MTATRTTCWISALAMLAACAAPPAPPTSVGEHITGELDKALADRKPAATPPAVSEALLPPLRMEMPNVAGQPLEPRFDLSVNNAPAAQVFMSLVTGTRYSILVHPRVTGTISVSLKDVTLREALDALRDLYGYEYRIEGSRISILPAGIQTRVFKVNYLTGVRRGTSDLRVQSGSVADVSAAPGQVAGGVPSIPGSPVPGTLPTARSIDSSRISTQQLNDFWAELRAALVAIVGSSEGRSVVVTPTSGVIVVRAMPEELRGVEQYLRETRIAVERQVMLEAKIIQVTLADQYQAGINWSIFRNRFSIGQLSNGTGSTGLSANPPGLPLTGRGETLDIPGRAVSAASTSASATNPANAIFGIAAQTPSFSALLQFLESQGAVQVLSSPRVATLNNEKAVLKVGTDEFFVTNVSTVTTTSGTATQQSPTVTVAPFFSGILLDVTPRIDDSGGIMLHIHPSISEVTESQRVVSLGGTIPSITLPLARSTVSETDTIVRASDGNIVAIGGLMSVDVRDNRGGIPGVNVPILRNTDRTTSKRELVILIKATVLADDQAWQDDLRQTEERLKDFYPSTPRGLRR
jgi:MSHA biogenesis protein MshL